MLRGGLSRESQLRFTFPINPLFGYHKEKSANILTAGIIKTAVCKFLWIPVKLSVPASSSFEQCHTYRFLTAATTACVKGDEALDILVEVPNFVQKVFDISPKSRYFNAPFQSSSLVYG